MTGNVEPHLRYGQLQGWFIDLPNGHKCYLKDSTKRKIIRQHYAWAIETAVLKQAKARGVTYAGVRVPYKDGKDLRRAQELVGAQLIAQQGRAIAIAEVPVGSQSARAMASYGICIGILASLRIPLIEVTPNEVKLAGAGVKNATKDEMIQWAMKEFPNANWLTRRLHGEVVPTDANEHLADAVGAIKAGVQTQQFRQALAMSCSFAAVTSVSGD